MQNEPTQHHATSSFGNLKLNFTGESYDADDIRDTKVEINGETLCFISWQDKQQFVFDLQHTIAKYRI